MLNRCEIDFTKIDIDKLFIGDIYQYKKNPDSKLSSPIEEKAELCPIMEDAILLKIGFSVYLNLSKIKTSRDMKKVNQILKTGFRSEIKKIEILGDFYKPYVDDFVVKNVKSYEELLKNKIDIKELKKLNIMLKP